MSEEERQRQMDFILDQQARFAVQMELLGHRVDTLATVVEGLRETQARTDEAAFRERLAHNRKLSPDEHDYPHPQVAKAQTLFSHLLAFVKSRS